MHEFERGEMEGYVAEVPEALGADKEIVQGIQPSFQCARRKRAGGHWSCAPRRAKRPTESPIRPGPPDLGYRAPGIGHCTTNVRLPSLRPARAHKGIRPTPRAEDKRVENGAPAIEDGRC